MSNLFIKNIPSIQEREFKFRAPMSSEQLNQMQKEAFNDLLDLFNKANQLQKHVHEVTLANQIETECYTRRLNNAITKISALEEAYNNLTAEDDMRTMTRYAFEAETINDIYAATIDKNTNDIVASISSSTSKTRLYDETYDESLVPPSLQVFIGPDSFKVNNDIYSIEDSDVIHSIFDGDPSTMWFRKVITSTEVESIENELVIGLPEDIITTRLINQIIINPFPAGNLDIVDVKYKSNGSWQTIPGFTAHHLCEERQGTDTFGNTFNYHVIENSPHVKFNFNNIQTSQLKIKLRQRNYTYDAENNRRIWYLGIKNIDVNYNVYTKDYSEFDMIYEFPETDRAIKVYDSEVFLNNQIEMEHMFSISKEYYYYDANGHSHKVSSTCPFILEGHKLRVKYVIDGSQETPNIYKCNVKYKII